MPEPPDEQRARSLMSEGAARLVAGVEQLGADWVVRAVSRLVDAWGRLDPPARDVALANAQRAGALAAARVADELRTFFALDPARQRTTPLQILRTLRFEATEVLAGAGIPEIERDPYEVRSFPDDGYGIVLKSPVELGDEELGGALLAWGVGKARLLSARAGNAGPNA